MVTETENFVFSDEVFTPFMDHVFASFGANRVLFGSDWPVCLLAADYSKVLAIIMDFLEQFDDKTKVKILRKNAQLIYNL
jgi:L-fuconolactonase